MLVLMNVREIHVEGQRNLCWDWARESLNSGLGFYLWEVVAGVKDGDVLTNPSSSGCCSVIQHGILTCSTGKELNAHELDCGWPHGRVWQLCWEQWWSIMPKQYCVAHLMVESDDGVGNSGDNGESDSTCCCRQVQRGQAEYKSKYYRL